MKSTPKVTVIMCVYNQEAFIREAIDSVLAQETDFEYEILLADDCSSDSTPAICLEYGQRYPERIRVVLNKRNKGVAANYFDCIREARGEYIADLAGDDIWCDKGKLAAQTKLLDSDPEIVLCHSAWDYLLPDGKISQSDNHASFAESRITPGQELLPLLAAHKKGKYFVHLCTSMYRRDAAVAVLDEYPEIFSRDDLPCEDYPLTVALATKGKFAWSPEKTLHYRVGHPSITTTADALKRVRFVCGVIALSLQMSELLGVDHRLMLSYYRFDILYALMTAFNANNIEGMTIVRALIKELSPRWTVSAKTRLVLALSHSALAVRLVNKLRKMRHDS